MSLLPDPELRSALAGIVDSGDGWRAFCPSCQAENKHGDRNLVVSIGRNGRTLTYCHRCGPDLTFADILAVLGIAPKLDSNVIAFRVRQGRPNGEVRERHRSAVQEARECLERSRPARASHPYLRRKRVAPLELRELGSDLVARLETLSSELRGVQRIRPNGDKRFNSGLELTGAAYILPAVGRNAERYIVAEGIATAHTLHAATDCRVIAALTARNLPHVATAIRRVARTAEIIIAADNDHQTCRRIGRNPGTLEGMEASRATGGVMLAPRFATDDPGSDWNDIAARNGLGAVTAAFSGADGPWIRWIPK